MDKYLIKYLVENADNELSKKHIDFFKVELDWHIYNSEAHISKTHHRIRETILKKKILYLYQYFYALFLQSNSVQSNKLKVLSTLHTTGNSKMNHSLSDLGFVSYSPIWYPVEKINVFGDWKTLKWHLDMQNRIEKEDFFTFLEPKFHTQLEEFQQHLLMHYQKQDFRALFLYTDQYFYSKYSIDIFKKMDRPSLIFTHGLPGIYSLEVDNRADYLMVWSEKIKQNYIKVGFSPSKIKVVGNQDYKNLPKTKDLRSDLSDVLIIPVSSVTWHQHEYNNTVVNDKSMVVLYLYKVQSVLKKLGIKRARYRVHPSINRDWVHAFLDQDFYVCDTQTLTDSLARTSLVIGSNSTVLLEALIQGVNYIAFDPKEENGVNMSGYKSVPPFDGSEEKLMMCYEEDELEKMLRCNPLTDYSLVHEFIQDFDVTVLKEIIK
jgi:hypothetical protein